jgi:hypothetical protein
MGAAHLLTPRAGYVMAMAQSEIPHLAAFGRKRNGSFGAWEACERTLTTISEAAVPDQS